MGNFEKISRGGALLAPRTLVGFLPIAVFEKAAIGLPECGHQSGREMPFRARPEMGRRKTDTSPSSEEWSKRTQAPHHKMGT
jgi:hypothetical protein